MKAKVTLTMLFDIGEGDPDEPYINFEERLEDGWYDELKSKLENRLFNYSYAHLIEHKWHAEEYTIAQAIEDSIDA